MKNRISFLILYIFVCCISNSQACWKRYNYNDQKDITTQKFIQHTSPSNSLDIVDFKVTTAIAEIETLDFKSTEKLGVTQNQELVIVTDLQKRLPEDQYTTSDGVHLVQATTTPNISQAEHSAHYEDAKIWMPMWSPWSKCLPELRCRKVRHLNWIAVAMEEFNRTEFDQMLNNDVLKGPNREEKKCDSFTFKKCYRQLVQATLMFSQDKVSCGNKPIDYKKNELVRNRRIIGGKTSSEGSWPWLLQLKISTLTKPLISCAASLISDRFFITAGHCIANLLTMDQMNSRNLPFTYTEWMQKGLHWQPNSTANLQTRNGVKIPIRAFHLHPEYKTFFSGPDIAILDIGKGNHRDLTGLEPVCLPGYSKLDLNSCYSAGWGYAANKPKSRSVPNRNFRAKASMHYHYWAVTYTHQLTPYYLPSLLPTYYMYNKNATRSPKPTTTLPIYPFLLNPREIKMPINDLNSCKISYNTQWLNEDRHICVGATGYGTCTGDSGGGFYCPDIKTNRWQLTGVISFHHSKGCGSHESVMANVSSQMLWLTTSIVQRIDNT